MERNRIATWWIHWRDLDWPNQDNMDKIKRRAEGLAKADVTAAMIFGAHFRWDYLPILPLLHDYLAAVSEELGQYGVKLFDHHSVNLVHRYSTREEMRRVMLHSGPHLPFSPTWEAASTWQYKGKFLNDWRMIDVKTGKPAWFPQYTGECFCHRNPEYKEAYFDYIKTLVADTGIVGLSADDAMHYMRLNTCGCRWCREELKRRAGIDLPPIGDQTFWYNWENEAWHQWLDLRFDATAEFYADLRNVLPEDFMLTGCGSDSASTQTLYMASDARKFLAGCNYVNMEMNGNTPPYKHDPGTLNRPIEYRLINAVHHQAAAREAGTRAFNTGFAHAEVTANHVWAVSKLLDADAWISTLKARLGLPWKILDTIPNEEDIVGTAFGFEKNHPDLFTGDMAAQLGVYFSYETRNHTMFGGLQKGYCLDFSTTVATLFRNGICPHALFRFPEDAETYPLILLPSAARMTAEEMSAMERYLASGGRILATGPSAAWDSGWRLPTKVDLPPEQCFLHVPDGIHPREAAWVTDTVLPECDRPNTWSEPRPGLLCNPHRISDGRVTERLLEFCRKYCKALPVKVLQAKGYLSAVYETEEQITVHFLSEDYDVDIDHELDAIRFHRSRVNYITKVEPIGIDGILKMETDKLPEVYTPFTKEPNHVTRGGGVCTVTLPDKCSYAIVRFKK